MKAMIEEFENIITLDQDRWIIMCSFMNITMSDQFDIAIYFDNGLPKLYKNEAYTHG